MDNKPIGEVIEAGTTYFIAECLEVPREDVPRLCDPPPFGAFVKIGKPCAPENAAAPGDEEEDPFAAPASPDPATIGRGLPPAVYALVCAATTASVEPNRRPSALGYPDEDSLRAEQPQIFELLRTEFSGLLVAYSTGDRESLRRYLPPVPPRIHSWVSACDAAEVRALTADLGFLRAILMPGGSPALSGAPSDDLAAACLRQARAAQHDPQEFLVRAGRTLANLLADDYDRLQAILKSVL
jgi:hypothetical protein